MERPSQHRIDEKVAQLSTHLVHVSCSGILRKSKGPLKHGLGAYLCIPAGIRIDRRVDVKNVSPSDIVVSVRASRNLDEGLLARRTRTRRRTPDSRGFIPTGSREKRVDNVSRTIRFLDGDVGSCRHNSQCVVKGIESGVYPISDQSF